MKIENKNKKILKKIKKNNILKNVNKSQSSESLLTRLLFKRKSL